jgi:hypothetical protein
MVMAFHSFPFPFHSTFHFQLALQHLQLLSHPAYPLNRISLVFSLFLVSFPLVVLPALCHFHYSMCFLK